MDIDVFMTSFGFGKNTFIIGIICLVVLLGNFVGGLLSNILGAGGSPKKERPMTQRTSFRIVMMGEASIIVYAIYYHIALVPGINTAQIIYWITVILAAPLLAALGAQLSYVAFASKDDGFDDDDDEEYNERLQENGDEEYE